jgi:hypothetical protein
MKIFKYALTRETDDDIELLIPEGFKIIHIGFQNDLLCLWAEVDPDAASEVVSFGVLGTGHQIPDDYKHLFTWFSLYQKN